MTAVAVAAKAQRQKDTIATIRMFFGYGRGDRIRTYDPLVPNQMRYQTALRPDVLFLTADSGKEKA
jgi:hypothetical protein